MGNTFGAGGDTLYLSNGGTAVFVDVLTLAVSALADGPCDHRFAALVAMQDQSMMGHGAVGFDLADLDWGATSEERAAAKAFVLNVLDLAARRHRWEELDYEPPFAEGYVRRFREIVAAFDPADADPDDALPDTPLMACCVRHRVLSGLPYWEGCVFCHQ
ncbi:hypothetical protein ACFUVV_19360 [Streptomyces sp. NPDC057376]|uniref:hypothetical protein n=1 Tax=unclassified Streptomyces TaxID=2593676 RepID=UPI00093E1433|nr:hypothetical protein [Streptomyces sp. CB02414]OKI80973.1 hypothetical protein AMK11_27625 [Streptomyces sp. CB02414]